MDQQQSVGGAGHFDAGKLPYELLPTDVLTEISAVFGYGAVKYGAYNWRKGMPWTKLIGSTLRHLLAWKDGEDTDPESDLQHLAHAMVDLIMLLDYQINGLGTDDRPKLDREMCAWTAGFIDGDGTISIAKVVHRNPPSTEYTPRVSAFQSDQAPLRRLQALWGGRIYPRKLSPLSKKQGWMWTCGTAQVRGLLLATLPLYVRKARQAHLALRLALRIARHGHGGTLTEGEQESRSQLHQQVKNLNIAGTGSEDLWPMNGLGEDDRYDYKGDHLAGTSGEGGEASNPNA